ncbi:MAG: DUF3445 domain-containing protein [Nitrospinae bacterium]|nr:DUF3445 domain-containing protein [Nitrospinota bacterium]
MKKNINTKSHKPPHFPFEDPPFRLSMGLLKVPEEEWFEIFDMQERSHQLAEKRKLLADCHQDVFMAHPSSLEASKEVFNKMVEHLPAVRPDLYSRTGDGIKLEPYSGYEGEEWSTDLKTNRFHPLDLAARWVQEDLVIMLPPDKNQSGWWLGAGSVAFPSRWSLKEKLGRTMDMIHAPVPFYEEQLRTPTNNFLDQMPSGEIFSRRNWSIHDDPTLRQDGTRQGKEEIEITSKNAGEKLWLRVERQTLKKLEMTGAVLFTIRIHLRKLKHIVQFEGIVGRLSQALSALPPEMHAYKQTQTFADSVQAYLDQF